MCVYSARVLTTVSGTVCCYIAIFMASPPKAVPFMYNYAKITAACYYLAQSSKRTGLNTEQGREGNKIKTKRQTASTETGRGRGKTGWNKNSERDLTFLMWGAGKDREKEKRKQGGCTERVPKFNLAPGSISIPSSLLHRCSHKISTPCKWHWSTFSDFPSYKFRLDICPPPPTPWVRHRGRFPDKNSQRNYSNTAAILLGVSAEYTRLKGLERG